MSRRAGRRASLINALEEMASLAGVRREAPLAASLWGAAEKAREVTGIALPPGDLVLHEPPPVLGPFPVRGKGVGRSSGQGAGDVARRSRRLRFLK
jgi:hypothetical protein